MRLVMFILLYFPENPLVIQKAQLYKAAVTLFIIVIYISLVINKLYICVINNRFN